MFFVFLNLIGFLCHCGDFQYLSYFMEFMRYSEIQAAFCQFSSIFWEPLIAN